MIISGTQQDIINLKKASQTMDTPAQANLIWCTSVHKQHNMTGVLNNSPAIVQRTGINKSVPVAFTRWRNGRPLGWAVPGILVYAVVSRLKRWVWHDQDCHTDECYSRDYVSMNITVWYVDTQASHFVATLTLTPRLQKLTSLSVVSITPTDTHTHALMDRLPKNIMPPTHLLVTDA